MARTHQKLEFSEIRQRALGRWPEILACLAIAVKPNSHGPCPGCGGKDRFHFDDQEGRGTWLCSGGGADLVSGDGFDLVRHVTNCSALEALQAVAQVVGHPMIETRQKQPFRQPTKPTTNSKRTYALELWLRCNRSDPIVAKHDYMQKKGFKYAHGAGVVDGVRCRQWEGEASCILVPIRSHGTGRVIAVQAINEKGIKNTFGSMTDDDGSPAYLLLGSPDPTHHLFVVEGFADAVSLVFLAFEGEAAAAISFGKSRLEQIAKQVHHDQGRPPVIIADRTK